MTTNQNRVAAGVRTGGQYATTTHAESTVALAPAPTIERLRWVANLTRLTCARENARAAAGGTVEHIDALKREYALTVHLALVRNPSLAGLSSLNHDDVFDATGRLLRSSDAELAELPDPAPMDAPTRAAAVRLFALEVSRSAERGPMYDSCLDAVADLGAGDASDLDTVSELRDDLEARRRHLGRRAAAMSEENVIDIVNERRVRAGLDRLR